MDIASGYCITDMIKSVIVVPSASSGKRSATAGNDAKTAKSEQSREKCVDKTVSSRSGGSSSATQCKSSLPVKVDDRKKLDNKNLKEASASHFIF
ncbi:hypothetical protein EB796_009538 [Bugula neritina]|uniref:Uncharacterized protein n=1 Tax=Bugula neritina TaxID=10212 RepID=A0A7J7K1U2_BUGNE|nr:hypothetical protein EB796_009538 [Bugula neritina]